MKKTFLVHLIFLLFLFPVRFSSIKFASLVSESITFPLMMFSVLFGIPILYFFLWFYVTIRVYKMKTVEQEKEI
ncbi:hypothetical protein [Virgibacillus halodenitrificans]|uniref:hypothetical protein n=1 Tax=Virgibacillus halodenitrificans TaxID=1482 RepID=UPI000EF44CDD|nr:hypothetical protein [Virgibacillus halodenitrificans]